MKRSKFMRGLALFSLLFLMAACSSSDEENREAENDKVNRDDKAAADSDVYSYEDFPHKVSNEAEPSGTGTLNIGYTSDS